MLIRLFQQRPRYWFSVRNRHNIWLSRTDKLKQPDKHKRTRQNPVNHQHWDLLRIIGFEEKYALAVCVVFHSKKTLPSLEYKSGPAYYGGVGSREIAANIPEAPVQLNSLSFAWIDQKNFNASFSDQPEN